MARCSLRLAQNSKDGNENGRGVPEGVVAGDIGGRDVRPIERAPEQNRGIVAHARSITSIAPRT